MTNFTDAERAYLTEMRGLTTDSKGRETLVGLTPEETDFYMSYSRDVLRKDHGREDSDRYLELHEKHEVARLGVLAAENQLRVDNPRRH